MIIKSFDIKKNIIENYKYFLLYGPNNGLIEEIIQNTLKPNLSKNLYSYEEEEILSNTDQFINSIINKSFFENQKLIIVSRATDKIKIILEEIVEKKIDDLTLIIKSNILDKKSKLRSYFEKANEAAVIPCYEDNFKTLNSLTQNFFKEKNIKVSSQAINVIIERSKGNRINLKNELNKISNYTLNKKSIGYEEIFKITNLSENYDFSELADYTLAKNKTKTLNIINENNFSSDDNIIILRNFLYKVKRLIKLKKEFEKNKNLESVLSSCRPPIFWKDKDIVRIQFNIFSLAQLKKLVLKINNVDNLIRKNSQLANIILMNFILENLNTTNN